MGKGAKVGGVIIVNPDRNQYESRLRNCRWTNLMHALCSAEKEPETLESYWDKGFFFTVHWDKGFSTNIIQ